MVSKNKDLKTDKLYYRKLIFSLILIIYFAGICAGCGFALKNGQNLAFVKKVMLIENLAEIEKSSVLAYSVKFLIRDILFVLAITVIRYSGVLKGMCLCVPFILSVQNACLYTVLMYMNETDLFSLVFHYIIKNTATGFVIIIYTYIVFTDILQGREKPRKDIRRMIIYIRGIAMICVIDFAVKSFIFPFQ